MERSGYVRVWRSQTQLVKKSYLGMETSAHAFGKGRLVTSGPAARETMFTSTKRRTPAFIVTIGRRMERACPIKEVAQHVSVHHKDRIVGMRTQEKAKRQFAIKSRPSRSQVVRAKEQISLPERELCIIIFGSM